MQQREPEKGTHPRTAKGARGTAQPPGDIITKRMEFLKAAREVDIPGRTTIQISQDTKSALDRIKQEAGVKTYDDAIRFLLEERRRLRPSTFGLLAGAGPFVRDEEEDSHRIRS